MPSDAGVPIDDERRLHPWSWLFVLLQQLRAFGVPLVLLVVTGRGNSTEWLGLVGVGALTAMAIVQYFSYRYRAGVDGVVISSGVLQRTRRDIPYDRIHTVNLHQTLLHRLFGVTEVRLESAGSKEAEAVMRVLSLAEARTLEHLIRERGPASRPDADVGAQHATPLPLLTLGPAEIVRLGLISNRGMVVVAAIVGLAWQVVGEGRMSLGDTPDVAAFVRGLRSRFAEQISELDVIVIGLMAVVAFLIVVRVLSVALALLQFYGFTLTETGRQLRIVRGLLSRTTTQIPKRRIQAWRIDETFVHRWFKRQTLRVDSAAGGDSDVHGVQHLAPVAPPETVDALIHRLGPGAAWRPAAWRPLHRRAWRRLFVVPSIFVGIAATLATARTGWPGLTLLGLLPLVIIRARRLARTAGYAMTSGTLVIRWGWLSRRWALVDVRKVQAVQLTQSPLDRRHGMAGIWFDTAGVHASDGALRIRYMSEDDARTLYDEVASALDSSRLRTEKEVRSTRYEVRSTE